MVNNLYNAIFVCVSWFKIMFRLIKILGEDVQVKMSLSTNYGYTTVGR